MLSITITIPIVYSFFVDVRLLLPVTLKRRRGRRNSGDTWRGGSHIHFRRKKIDSNRTFALLALLVPSQTTLFEKTKGTIAIIFCFASTVRTRLSISTFVLCDGGKQHRRREDEQGACKRRSCCAQTSSRWPRSFTRSATDLIQTWSWIKSSGNSTGSVSELNHIVNTSGCPFLYLKTSFLLEPSIRYQKHASFWTLSLAPYYQSLLTIQIEQGPDR